ncbi:MAG: hypothetical protein JOY80_01270 [Candidatus Dormibacteraeota bacterium]|nr:hypothetical protein [Candidatus Dormibacteraeota bacterium]
MAVAAVIGAAKPVIAASIPPPRPDIPLVIGECTFDGGLTQTFSPGVGAFLGDPTVTVVGGGTCQTNYGAETVYINLGGSVLLTCAGGEGSLGGTVSFSGNAPPLQFVTAQYVGGPFSEELTITSPGLSFVGEAAFGWLPTSDDSCLLSGLSNTPVLGSFTFAYA